MTLMVITGIVIEDDRECDCNSEIVTSSSWGCGGGVSCDGES